jgi:hypothetical protein
VSGIEGEAAIVRSARDGSTRCKAVMVQATHAASLSAFVCETRRFRRSLMKCLDAAVESCWEEFTWKQRQTGRKSSRTTT